jgi:hypothetical protein
VLTTNLDHLLERAFDWAWPSLWGQAAHDLLRRRGFIFKLHGTLLERDSWVFTREQYDQASWGHASIRDTLDRFFHAYPLLFVGFELAGDYFDTLLSQVRALSGNHPPVNYALVPAGSIQEGRRQHLERAGIRLLEYSNADGQHTEALRLLTELAGSPPWRTGLPPLQCPPARPRGLLTETPVPSRDWSPSMRIGPTSSSAVRPR